MHVLASKVVTLKCSAQLLPPLKDTLLAHLMVSYLSLSPEVPLFF